MIRSGAGETEEAAWQLDLPERTREVFFLEDRIEFVLVAPFFFFFVMGGVCEREKERKRETSRNFDPSYL